MTALQRLALRLGSSVQAFLVRVREGYGPARPEDITGEDRYGACIEEIANRLAQPDDLHLTFPAWERPTPLVEDDPWAEWLDLGEAGA